MPSLSSTLIWRWNVPDIRPSLIAKCAVLLIRSPHFTLSWPTSGFTHKPVATTTTTTTPHTHPHTPTPTSTSHPKHPPTRPTPTLLVLIQLPSPSNPRPQLFPLPRPPFHPISTLPDFSDSTPKLSTQSVNAPSPHTHQPLTWSCYYCLLLLPTPLQTCRLLFKLAYVCFMATPSTFQVTRHLCTLLLGAKTLRHGG